MSARCGGDLWTRLIDFRATHPLKHVDVGDVRWSYLACGQGRQALLLLIGALGDADIAFPVISELETSYRVIAPSYPAIDTMTACADGIAAVLAAEGVERAYVLGGSFGGVIAQGFARQRPDRVGKLVLSHTFFPNARQARRLARFGWLLSVLPTRALRCLMRMKLRKALPGMEDAAIREFLRAYVAEKLATFTKEEIRSRLQIILDFARRYASEDHAAIDANRPVLILEGDNDAMIPAPDRRELRRRYPNAQVHTFRGTGHAASMLRPEEYMSGLNRFLAD